MHRRLGRQAEQVAAYKDIAGPEWGPKVAALVCCAHFLEHHLREGPAPLLLLDLQVCDVNFLVTTASERRCSWW